MNSLAIRPEVLPFVAATLLAFGLLAVILRRKDWRWTRLSWACAVPACVGVAYLCYFFRDPERTPPRDPDAIVAGADGTVAAVANVYEGGYMGTNCVRISIFLSLFDVHVNRAPISGKSTFLGYFPGKRLFTFQEKSSEVNQHNKILIEDEHTRCLVNQIVGPVTRRVVYWLPHDQTTQVAMGERIGMMKFGSRLDIYLPADSVDVVARPGDTVRAGETIIARVKGGTR
ncbi:MAG: phosphatidylserine decarboxylase family protein [Lentisphaerae bacterium]|nr:phosphatidylserine decarboxylase family protein [Planctomycetota bacterium]MBM4148101.1 phosphatidylserine decarboxylase family protein [Lentisphaerota bacterium]